MKIRVLGAYGGHGADGVGPRPAAFLVDDRVLVDAGSVTSALGVSEQLPIEHALLSHAHLDHIAGLAFLAESLSFETERHSVTVASVEPVVTAVRTGIFNNVIWPDFAQIPADSPVLGYRHLAEAREQRVGDLWVTPVAVTHSVPAYGFIVRDGNVGFVYTGDTGPTTALWQAVRGVTGLRAVIIECAFPNRLAHIAKLSCHMTPALIERELEKMPPDVPVWVFHLKPSFYEEIAGELARIPGGRVSVVEQDKTYTL
jgi:ribonuclease BN (tRNA processing enzyme)